MLPKRNLLFSLIASLWVCGTIVFAAEAPRKSQPPSRQLRQEAPSPPSQRERSGALKHVEDEILVRFKDDASELGIASAHAIAGGASMKRFRIVSRLNHVKLPHGLSVKEAIKLYQEHPDVLYAEPNYIVEALVTPNDPSFGSLWGLQNVGQGGGTVDADIDAPGAWDITAGSSAVVVAVIDTGVDYNHADLSGNIWSNADCNNNGIDDDGNGYVDDCHGIDVVNNDSNPMDDNSHGTHVSGTIGATGNDGLGVVGVNWDVSIMACKFLSAAGSGTTAGAIACLNYVAMMKDRGVNIVATNNSWGGGGFSQALYDAIDAHRQRGILFIAAAGNAALNNDSALFYPASYYLPNLISVAATDRFDGLAYFSNYGRRTVHVGAPGLDILSTTPDNTYSTFSGTSMATPHVTGVAALLKAQDPSRDWRAIKNLILAGGDNNSALGNTITRKRLNAQGSLACLGSTVSSRLKPIGNSISGSVGTPTDLAALNIDCANPNGNVTVTVNPGGQVITLLDDGLGVDQAAGDGIYSGQFTPSATGDFTLTFSNGEVVTVLVNVNYTFTPAPFNYRTIAGTNLNFGDDFYASIASPFPVPFGGGSFSTLWASSNGNVNFSGPFTAFSNGSIPTSQIATLVAPYWDDLYSIPFTDQNVFWQVIGTAPNRELVIEWRDVRHFSCAGDALSTVKFQAVFFEGSSDILFNYADTAFGGLCAFADLGASATVGVQQSSTAGTQFSFNRPTLANNSALLWSLASPQPPTPTINVTPSSQDFGNVGVGSSADRTFTVSNAGGGTLTGTASTSAPFTIVSGGSYSLAAGQSQLITVRFSPTATGVFLGNAAFTGDGDASRLLQGVGVTTSTLTVAKTGPGNVTSDPGGVNCGNDCSESYNYGTVVTLIPAPDAGAVFGGWGGDPDCLDGVVTMNADKTCAATFVTPLALGSLLLPSGEVGVSYGAPLVTGGVGPYSFTLLKGVFPPGLNGNSANGRLAGTPTLARGGSFAVRITDQLGSSVTGNFRLTILRALGITTTALKAGINGRAYRGVFKAVGGHKPYNWSLVGGSLPSGLTLSALTGAIAGIPTQTGTFDLIFQVTDPVGGLSQKAMTLTIN